ncbi:MAG: cytochrome c [Bauldia sp.]
MKPFTLIAALAGVALLALVVPHRGAAEDATAFGVDYGREEFRISCSACHGVSAKGDGPVAELLKVKPADLTRIASRNGGVFPVVAVATLVHGRDTGRAHGNDMPIWGNRYLAESTENFGPFLGEMVVRARILSLVFYLETIQER